MPKQFALLGGKPLVRHSAERMLAHDGIDCVVVIIGSDQSIAAHAALEGLDVEIATGGDERQDSVRAGLEAAAYATHVLIHDAARPFVSVDVLDRLIAALDHADGVVPILPVADTLARGGAVLGDVVDRSGVVRVQTPQAFRRDVVLAAHRAWQGSAATDDAQMVRAIGLEVATVEGDAVLEKVTHPADFAVAEARIVGGLTVRTGMGYDVHRLARGRPLWLGGLLIDHDKGLSGHSDADVALHALVDALLGAAGDGDIGDHFPPSDPQWSGAASSRFVEHARDRIAARGGIIDHVDLTIICEAPRIGPHRAAMRATIAALLRVDQARVSIKATTTERLGFTGRGEGIAAQAVATIRI